MYSNIWFYVKYMNLNSSYPECFLFCVFTEKHPYLVIGELNNSFSSFLYGKVIILVIITEVPSLCFFQVQSIYSKYQQLELCILC